MIKKFLFLCIFASLMIQTSEAQVKQTFRWGKISAEEQAIQQSETDPTAPAIVLHDYGVISVNILVEGIKYRYRRHRRVKIFDPATFQMQVDIPFYSKLNAEKLTSLKAQVISPNGKKQNLNKKDFLYRDIDEEWMSCEFSFPELEKGSIIEYRYEIQSDRISKLRDWYFQEDIPVRYSELRLELPEWLEYITLIDGELQPEKKTTEDDNFVVETNNDEVLERDPRLKIETSRYVMENVPALRTAPYMTNLNDYRAKIRFQLSKIHYPNKETESYLSSWEELSEELLKAEKFGQQFQEEANFSQVLESVAALNVSGDDNYALAEKYYTHLNKKMKWNGNYGLLANNSLNELFTKGEASGSELNMMLLALLRQKGINAHPLLISTRQHGQMIQQYPIFDQFNHMLVYIEREGQDLMLDLSDSHRAIEYIRPEALNGYGWLVRKGDAEWITIEPLAGSDMYIAQLKLDEKGTLEGTLRGTFSGYNAVEERRQFTADRQGQYWQKRLAPMGSNVSTKTTQTENLEDLSKPFKTTLEIKLPGMAKKDGDRIYFNTMMYTRFAENQLKAETRNYPVDFTYPFKEQYVFELTIPEGYEVEQLPESKRVITRSGGGAFHFILKEVEGKLQLISKIQVKQLKYSPEEYDDIKEFFDHIAAKFKEQVVLRKKK